MKKYRMVISPLAWDRVRRNQWVLDGFNPTYSNRVRRELSDTLREIRQNPYLFPLDESDGLPEKKYRRALFAKWYKIIYQVTENTIYVNTVVDCRMDPETIHRELE